MVAENKPGAGGVAGTDSVVRSAPDGYTLVLMDPALVINPSLMASLPYSVFKDLKTVSMVSSSPLVLVVSPQLPAKTYAEFLAYAKANPGKLNFSSAGIGTTPHLASEMWAQRTGVTATHIPYRGIGQSFTDMMANKVQFAFSSFAGALPFTKDNRLLPLAVSSMSRVPLAADLPTVDELGLKGFDVDLWYGIFAPAAVPADVLAKLNAALTKALASPELKAAFAKVAAVPHPTSPQDGDAFIKAEYEKWKKVIADGNIKEN